MSPSPPLALLNGSPLGQRPTGIGVVTQGLAKALHPDRVMFLDPVATGHPNSLAVPNTLSSDSGRQGHLRRLLWTQHQLPGLLKQTGASFLLSPLPEAPILRKGVRSIVLAHDLIPLRFPRLEPLLAYHLAYVPFVLHQAERVLCNSEATAREIHHWLRVPRRKLMTIPLGFDQGRLRPLDLPRQPFFLVLGRHDHHKNLPRVLRAFAHLRDPDLCLKLVGPPHPRRTPWLRRLAAELGIAHQCQWISWVNDKERLWLINTTQALVIPSLWEGFGLPALEAMACGTAVIAGRAGALPEVVGSAGLLVDPASHIPIAEAMARVLSDRGIQHQARQAGPDRSARFRWENTARQVEALLEQLA
ncbi:MAG: glycosyltransferase family 4 protein [Synechococcus sp. SB0662_bin_45]|uniref:Glycosyltransferase family 4 protein n=1 Tax=Synechococcus sp. SB0676_bin_10 TaxID=2604869 RepID=A0A6B1FBQ6_9SYNE|nr:glycosyltransferase family 1 protein [Cyanobacteria bacterium MAG IRC3_bin_20]MDE0646652.1 glycosyltransferase family 1 protein [Cyanobacteria bacterium MAG IRC4_bin_6]MXW11617.1 glycosyltransferase family 4 protein [Synechococcus sp. SB0668_bin_13]MYE22163.1 glycosyltransferase family 4 protein [Synechococcus sp. SB0662_bin_45]MYG39206.1 glycosyltransferase family 4 protein [Synechococcus sp. SB0676_bin_10]MYG63871.1 glycosyltransferase family 4 protein [Synechococcus sp. SB0675_bin_7]MYK